jgi:predicted component of type VI protein secretion system
VGSEKTARSARPTYDEVMAAVRRLVGVQDRHLTGDQALAMQELRRFATLLTEPELPRSMAARTPTVKRVELCFEDGSLRVLHCVGEP